LFLQGISDELRQQHRDQLFAVTKKSVIGVAAKLVITPELILVFVCGL